ncbi:NADP oxidoreductase [Actinorhabdospora filicis]|uniref:NADP oxidoreductase n=1 Tax=Actinorhabdospora filicis TaxID=1785913 RepID=A0A9W6SKL6_9ACTN|nr:NADPH-dependent F420 reductase [Actinorhabdospora filicis]GLZ77394.1 NADP oxidoreductase [Actinorhabdospora filicis]
MDILIVGAGSMARGIGTRLLAGGHPVHIADRDPQKAKGLAAELDGDATGHDIAEGPEDSDVVVLAVPYPANVEIARNWAAQLAGKLVVDISNPVDFATFDDLTTPEGTSAAEQVAQAAPGAKVVKAFNTTFAGNLVNGTPMDVLIAGDDDLSREAVAKLAVDGGLRPVSVGGLKHARQLEGFQLLHMKVQDQIGGGWASTVGFGG